jgi:hypothetical protein
MFYSLEAAFVSELKRLQDEAIVPPEVTFLNGHFNRVDDTTGEWIIQDGHDQFPRVLLSRGQQEFTGDFRNEVVEMILGFEAIPARDFADLPDLGDFARDLIMLLAHRVSNSDDTPWIIAPGQTARAEPQGFADDGPQGRHMGINYTVFTRFVRPYRLDLCQPLTLPPPPEDCAPTGTDPNCPEP